MANNYTDFKEIIRKIESSNILLPDFQREFVWKDEEQQKKIVASVLARMPIGSILLLKSKPDEYSCKKIGCKTEVDSSQLGNEVEFLLDGQQRITVLANVFSNIIHDQCTQVSELISPSLKRRFFLRIPKWANCHNEADLFGIQNLQFTYKHPDSEDPEFLSSDIFPFVECLYFLADDETPYHPKKNLGTALDTFCLNYEKGYLIPLYLLAPSTERKDQCDLRYITVTKKISEDIGNEIITHYVNLTDTLAKDAFIDKIFTDESIRSEIKSDYSIFHDKIEERVLTWNKALGDYLKACVEKVSLNQIIVKEEQRARAIDIYENLNRGGISLNTFDLIMARVAKVSKENYYKRIVSYMQSEKTYSKDVLPSVISGILSSDIDAKKYNATINTACYKDNKNEITSKYIDAFLDVLSLYCYNPSFDPDSYKIEYIKREHILRLTPKQIDENTEKACIAMDRALFFFQTRCGIRNIQELNYSLMLVLVATIFVKDDYFSKKSIHDKLEAWYWASIFSGEYDKDQNVTMISHLQSFTKTLQGQKDISWINSLKNNVLDTQNFSDQSFLLMEKVDEDRYPKDVLRAFMCQYLLAKTYADMFNSINRISVFSANAKDLEAHHIIPLGSVNKIGDSTRVLRENKKHICNSPLNFVFITKTANNDIGSDNLDTYAAKVCDEAKSALHISAYTSATSADDDTKIKSILKQRYSALKGDIKQHIANLLV